MKSRLVHGLGAMALGSLLCAGCTAQRATEEPSIDTLASAIRAAGYACADIVNSNELDRERDSYRVVCGGTLTYSANVSNAGSICVTPVPYVDAVTPTPAMNIAERCVSASDI
jgi:hypothetical protein